LRSPRARRQCGDLFDAVYVLDRHSFPFVRCTHSQNSRSEKNSIPAKPDGIFTVYAYDMAEVHFLSGKPLWG
jgi:hypothetical protein